MLDAGIEIAECRPTMFHVKSLVVDGHFSSVGSTNFDNRSFRLDDEANLNVLDAEFGARQRDTIRQRSLGAAAAAQHRSTKNTAMAPGVSSAHASICANTLLDDRPPSNADGPVSPARRHRDAAGQSRP